MARLSVAMCTYNGAAYLNEQLLSIQNQTRRPDEMVVCDDGSSDETLQILWDFAEKAAFQVDVLSNSSNLGISKNFEKAVKHCSGDVIFLADQDDVWLPSKLERIETIFAERPKVGMVFTNGRVVDERRRPKGITFCDLWINAACIEAMRQGRSFEVMMYNRLVTGATMAYRSKWNALVTPIPVTSYFHHDAWIAALVSAVAEIVYLPEPLIDYRHHPGQQIGLADGVLMRNKRKAALNSQITSRLMVLEEIRQRLLHHSDLKPNACELLKKFEAEINHLRARQDMPKHRLFRVPTVLRLLVGGEYNLYSNGWRSAARDILLSGQN